MSNKIVKLNKNNHYYIAGNSYIKILEELLSDNINIYYYDNDFYINFNSIINRYSIENPFHLMTTLNKKNYIKINNIILVNQKGFNGLVSAKKIKRKKIEDKKIYTTILELFEILDYETDDHYAEDDIYKASIKKIKQPEYKLNKPEDKPNKPEDKPNKPEDKPNKPEDKHNINSNIISTYEEKYINLEMQFKMLINTNETEKIRFNEIKEQYDCINNEYSNLLLEYDKNKKQLHIMQKKYDELKEDYDDIKIIATNLAKYVRVNNINAQDAYSDHFEIDDDFISEQDKKNITKNAQISKYKLNNNIICKRINNSYNKTIIKNDVYSLMRSSYTVDNYKYKWELQNNISDSIKEDSENYLLDETGQPPFVMLWYCDISVSKEKIQAIMLFFDLAENICDEHTIVKLLNA
jgi:hypothetical protein